MDKYQGYRFPLNESGHKVCASATLDTIEIGPVPTGRIWAITNLAIEDQTTAFTCVRIYIKGFGEKHYIMEDRNLQAGYLYNTPYEFYIPEGRSLGIDFYGCTLADVLRVWASGFEMIQPREG